MGHFSKIHVMGVLPAQLELAEHTMDGWCIENLGSIGAPDPNGDPELVDAYEEACMATLDSLITKSAETQQLTFYERAARIHRQVLELRDDIRREEERGDNDSPKTEEGSRLATEALNAVNRLARFFD